MVKVENSWQGLSLILYHRLKIPQTYFHENRFCFHLNGLPSPEAVIIAMQLWRFRNLLTMHVDFTISSRYKESSSATNTSFALRFLILLPLYLDPFYENHQNRSLSAVKEFLWFILCTIFCKSVASQINFTPTTVFDSLLRCVFLHFACFRESFLRSLSTKYMTEVST